MHARMYISMYVCIAICVGLSFSSSHDQSLLKQLQAKLSNSPSMVIQVRRSDILKDALQEAKKKIFRLGLCNIPKFSNTEVSFYDTIMNFSIP